MPRFRFRLQTVLSYKEQVADAEQQALAQAQARRAAAEADLATAAAARDEQAAALRALLRPGAALDLAAVEQGQRRLESLEQAIAACRVQVEACQRAEEEQRQRLVAAMQEQKSLERLRDRQSERAQAAEARAETKQNDEAGLQRFDRQRRQR